MIKGLPTNIQKLVNVPTNISCVSVVNAMAKISKRNAYAKRSTISDDEIGLQVSVRSAPCDF